jgi:hypothetical protein
MTRHEAETKASRLAAEILANVDDMYSGRVAFDVFHARARALWDEAQPVAALVSRKIGR